EQVGEDLVALLLAVGVVVPGSLEMVVPAPRPVDLVEVDAVGGEAPEAALDGLAHARGVDAATAAHPGTAAARDLAGEDHLIAPAGLREPAADDLLGPAIGLGRGRHRVHLRRVDEVHALAQRVV